MAVIIVLWACGPLLTIPIYIGRPLAYVEVINAEGVIVSKPVNISNESDNVKPAWKTLEPPIAYVQQIIVKAMVHPYRKEELIKTDAFRYLL
jgi:hypothetical protein